MAESCRFDDHKSDEKSVNHEVRFNILNVLCVLISLLTIVADATAAIVIFAEYRKLGYYMSWALGTLIFILIPNVLINIFSIRWYVTDKKSNVCHWITHCCLLGLLDRYISFISTIFVGKNEETTKKQKLFVQRNDLNLLHFLYVFTGTVPQIILQSYAIISFNEIYYTKIFVLIASTSSVIWSCATYIYSTLVISNKQFHWLSLFISLIWHCGMLVARISAILLFTYLLGIWTLVPLGLHWFAMTFWILTQKTTFCANKLEEILYNVVMGYVYCFCYINLREGHTRYRLIIFYTVMVIQNLASLFLYVAASEIEKYLKVGSRTASVCIVAGTVIGMTAMILYYRYFHPRGPIQWKNKYNDIEPNNEIKVVNQKSLNKDGLGHVRSFKTTQKVVDGDCSDNLQVTQLDPESVEHPVSRAPIHRN